MRKTQFTLAPLALAAFLTASVGNMAHAQTAPVVNVSIAAQPLGQALNELARQANLQLSFPAALVTGKTAPAVAGSLTLRQALDRLLAGSGLTADISGLEVIVRRVSPAPDASSGTTLATVVVTAQAERSSLTEGLNSYASSEMSMAKGQTIREIPQSVSVITRQQIEDQNLNTIDDVLNWTPGVVATGSLYAGRQGGFYTRGMAMRNLQVDGSSVGSVGNDEQLFRQEGSNTFDMAIYDHVEVLRGSDGLYSGVGDSAGTVNLVRKRPTKTFQGSAVLSAGSWNNYQEQLDLSGPLAFDGKLRGRFVAARQDKHAFNRPSGDSSNLFYGILEADLGPQTTLAVGATHNKSWGIPQGQGLPSNADGSDYGFPRDESGVAPWSRIEQKKTELFADLKHSLNEKWTINAKLNHTKSDSMRTKASIAGGSLGENGIDGMGQIVTHANGYEMSSTAYDINISGDGQWGGRKYSVLLGVDGSRRTIDEPYNEMIYNGRNYRFEYYDYATFDWSNYPEFSYKEWPQNRYILEQRSVYGRTKLELFDSLHLIFGGRYTDYKYRTEYLLDDSSDKGKESGIITPYYALVYDINDQWIVYGSTARIYTSQRGYLKGPEPGTSLDPMEGRTYEIGTKAEWLDGRLNSSFALYRVEKTGEAVGDPAYDEFGNDDGDACCYLNKGKVVSQGFEATVHGEILPRLQISAGYTYNHNKDKQNGDIPYNTLYSPKHLVKIFAKYGFSGDLSRLEVGGGVTAQSGFYRTGVRYGTPWRLAQASYSVWSAFANYSINKNLKIALNIDNLFDKVYFKSLNHVIAGRHYGEPRKYTVTLRTWF